MPDMADRGEKSLTPVTFAEALRCRKRDRFGASQRLWSKLEDVADQTALFWQLAERERNEDRKVLDEAIFGRCLRKLNEARRSLEQWGPRRSFVFWEGIHGAAELLILVTPDDMLAGTALGVLTQFQRNIKDRNLRREWLGPGEQSGPLAQAFERAMGSYLPAKAAGKAPSDSKPEGTRRVSDEDRCVLKDALHTVNDQGDTHFFWLGTRTSLRLWGAALLAILLLIFGLWGVRALGASDVRLLAGAAALLGAIGAIASSMMARSLVFATGATARFFAYNLLAKPVLGAFSAAFVLLVEQSGILFKVIVSSDPAAEVASYFIKITVNSPPQAILARAVIAVIAGYAGERLLTSMFDRLQQNLFAASEKTGRRTTEA
jgi:hypothetical protein